MLGKSAILAFFTLVSLLFPVFESPVLASEGNIINEINAYRQSKGLAAIRTDAYTCNFAKTRAEEITGNFSHTGFYNRISAKTLPYPNYHLVTENLAWVPGGQDAVNMWINSPAHNANLLKNTPIACVERHGDYIAFEGWRP